MIQKYLKFLTGQKTHFLFFYNSSFKKKRFYLCHMKKRFWSTSVYLLILQLFCVSISYYSICSKSDFVLKGTFDNHTALFQSEIFSFSPFRQVDSSVNSQISYYSKYTDFKYKNSEFSFKNTYYSIKLTKCQALNNLHKLLIFKYFYIYYLFS